MQNNLFQVFFQSSIFNGNKITKTISYFYLLKTGIYEDITIPTGNNFNNPSTCIK